MNNQPLLFSVEFMLDINYVTIAHITALLVALTAAKHGMKDKIRFIKSFLPSFNP